ncbi:MAG: hypothetical protein GF309_09970 [Candidatus Lokiarchaeota archaeon]|nr:hypothetical protein [Candidatus Lokiarchaeota archaeon]
MGISCYDEDGYYHQIGFNSWYGSWTICSALFDPNGQKQVDNNEGIVNRGTKYLWVLHLYKTGALDGYVEMIVYEDSGGSWNRIWGELFFTEADYYVIDAGFTVWLEAHDDAPDPYFDITFDDTKLNDWLYSWPEELYAGPVPSQIDVSIVNWPWYYVFVDCT